MRQLSVSIPSVSDSSAGNVPSLIYNLYQLYVSDPSAHGSNAELIKVSVESVSVSGEPQSFGRYIYKYETEQIELHLVWTHISVVV